MAKVSLRVYNHEIESMLEGGQLDEAVAHCQHILKTFPMHIETYRLLGKTFLEARRYGDAADIFQRALMAVPDDFVSHVGMSIIHDDAGKLDDAIWHMERAFEVQPSNPAIQGELRRLYGRRDGVEPPKIRLSRDALANMYSQGELFNQAISEIRAVLADDPNRPDLQVMLARAYFRAGQKVEAAEMAANLLKKYQYCLDALRILVDVLPGTARADNTQVYRQRLRLLDPYSSFVTGSVFSSDQVADTAVNLERLEYKPGAAPVIAAGSGWASSLGIKLESEQPAEEQPDWLSGAQKNESALPAEPIQELPASAPAPSAPNEEIPEWMRSSGWQESTGAATEGPVDFGKGETPTAEPLAQADIPEWLQSMAPPEVTGAATSEAAPAEGENGDFPDWLTNLGTAAAGTAADFTAEGFDQPVVQDAAAAGLADLEPPAKPASSLLQDDTPFQPTGESKPLGIENDTFAWLEGLAAKQGARPEELLTNAEERSDEIPDWLRGEEKPASGDAESADSVPPAPEPEPPFEIPSTPAAEAPAASSSESAAFQPTGEVKPLGIEDGTFAWLEGLAAKQGARPDELLTNAEDRSEEVPESLRDEESQPAPADEITPEPLAPAPELAQESHAPGTGTTFEPAGEAKPLGIENETFAWLESLAAKQGARPDELLTNAEERAELPADWVPTLPPQAAQILVEETPTAFENPADEPSAQVDEEQSVADWLNRLDEKPAAPEAAAVIVPPAATPEPAPSSMDGLPDWLQDLEKPAPAPAEEAPGGATVPDLPDWLRDTGPVGEAAPAASGPEMPAWINGNEPGREMTSPASQLEPETPAWVDENVPVAEAAAPVMPEEWLPVEEKSPEANVPDVNESAPVQQVVQSEVPHVAGILSRVPVKDKDGDLLASSQAYLDENRLNEAMLEYAKLIKKGRLLDEVIHDLREAIYRFPVDVIVWQTLGDASMRANRLQDALDAYTKAEELLR